MKEIPSPSIAVIGTGYWGKNLVRNYYHLGNLKLLCDKNEIILTQFKEEYPDIEICLALNDVLSRDDIQGVVIASPAETHYAIAKESLLAGKHIFVEKPLALHESEGQELISLANQKQLVLMVGHLLQFHPVFSRLKQIASAGELGRINYIYSHRLNLGKIRREENILWSFAPHDISMILSLAGEDPESVLATGGNYLHKKIADVTTTHLEFPSGLHAHIFVSWLHPFKEQKLVVVGTSKMAVFDDTKPWEDKLLLYPHEIQWQNNLPVPVKAEPERLDIPQDEPLRVECEHFIECISNATRPITDGFEGIQVLKVLNASQRSLDQNGKTIYLHEQEKAANGLQTETQTVSSKEVPTDGRDDFFAHDSAYIDNGSRIGKGTKIWHFSHILPGTKIGQNCNIGQNVVVGPDVSIGDGCKIQNNVSVYKGVTLEEYVFCGPSMVFTNVFNPRAAIKKMGQARTTLVKKGTTIGANATIVCGHTIGRYAFIGAGAVITKDVPDHAIMLGNPAVRKGWACECGERLPEELKCSDCGAQFEETEKGLTAKDCKDI